MLRKFAVAAMLGALAASALAASAMAQCVSPVLVAIGGDSFAYETVYQTAPADSFNSHAGSLLTVVGKIPCFGPPLDYLNGNMSTKEYTFVFNLTSLGTVKSVPAGQNGENWDTNYTGGTWSIYEDAAMNAPGAATLPSLPAPGVVPDKFVDGTLILTGVFDAVGPAAPFATQVTLRKLLSGSLRFGGSWAANYHATGGRPAEFALVGTGIAAAGFTWCTYGPGTGQCSISPVTGYSAHPSGKFDAPPTVTPALGSTWGKLKLLYR